jgi:HEAT repeat protein
MTGLADSLQFLATTENEAAVPVLLAALRTPDRKHRERVLHAVLQRASPAAELEVLTHWHRLNQPMCEVVVDKPGWLSGAIRQALTAPSLADPVQAEGAKQLCKNACAAALATRDFDQIPLLVTVAMDLKNPCHAQAAQTALLLAELLYEELHAPRDYRVRRDPQLQRTNLLPCLERAADSVYRHQKWELVEALLLLAERETATVKRILQSPRDPSFPTFARVLKRSSRPGVVRLLLSYLDDAHAPRPALEILAARRDLQFIRQLLRKIGNQPAPVVRNNLHRLDEIPWLNEASSVYEALAECEQPAAVHLVSEADLAPAQALQLLSLALQSSSEAGRRAAAAALAKFPSADADEIALQALDDEDPLVRAQAVARMGGHATPTVIPRLLEMLDSPHQPEREAAQQCLNEYSCERYLQAFDTMSPEARLTTGQLVQKVDPSTSEKLMAELQSPVRARRARALEIATILQLIPDLFDQIVPLLNDEDHYTRLDAVRTLAACGLDESQQALRRALLDHSPLVAQAAEEALGRIRQRTAEGDSEGEAPIPTETVGLASLLVGGKI